MTVAWITTKAGSGVRAQSRIVAANVDGIQLVSAHPIGTGHEDSYLIDESDVVHPTRELTEALLDLAPDIVVFHEFNPDARAALRQVHPYFVTVVRLGINLHAELLIGNDGHAADALEVLHLADHVIASGTHPESILRAVGFDDSRVTVIPSMIEADSMRRPPDRAPPTVGVIGRIDRLKNQYFAVEVANGVKALEWDATPDVLLAGDQNDRTLNAISSSLDAMGFPGQVHHLGFVHDTFGRFWRQVGVHLVPSYTENCPQTVLEAAVAGVPTIAAGGFRWASDFEKLLRAPLDDPARWSELVHELLTDDDTRKAVVTAQQGMLERYRAEAVAPRYRALFDELTDGLVDFKIPPGVVA